jgi:predicted DNA-binding ribbon-helix-helix protein
VVLMQGARDQDLSLASLIGQIDAGRGERPLASACRVAALGWAGRHGNA